MENIVITNLRMRRSIRSYTKETPSRELIAKVVEAGLYAPSGQGKQPTLMVVVTDEQTREQLSRLNASFLGTTADPFYGAPAIIIVFADRETPTYLYDGALVMGNMLNAAHAEGLGSCWIHRAKEMFESDEGKALMKKWNIADRYEGIGICIVGFPADEVLPHPHMRKGNRVIYI